MSVMPRTRKPYVQRETTRHGKVVWYFRRDDGPRIRLRGDYESEEWLADYDAAFIGVERVTTSARSQAGTLRWLIQRYEDSVAFAGLAPSTQRARSNILKRVAATGGDLKLTQITKKTVIEGRDRRSKTPVAAVTFVKVMRTMFDWAVKAEHMTANPALGVDSREPKTDGHHTWTVDEVHAFYKRHPLGTRARLALDILLYTGMRRGDAVLFGRQHVRDGRIRYRSQKTGIDVDLLLLEPLRISIEATATSDLAFLATEDGHPFASAASFGMWFQKRCKEAGVPGRAHGLRKAGATFAAENGASDLMLMAMWGWTDARQAGVYTRRASRAKLAADAGRLLAIDETGTSIPAPSERVRGSGRKA